MINTETNEKTPYKNKLEAVRALGVHSSTVQMALLTDSTIKGISIKGKYKIFKLGILLDPSVYEEFIEQAVKPRPIRKICFSYKWFYRKCKWIQKSKRGC